MPISYGQQWPPHALRALAQQANGATYASDWFPVDDCRKVVIQIRVTAGAGFTLAPVVETTNDSASGTAHALATLTSHTTTGAKDVEDVEGFSRYIRISAPDPLANVTWQAIVTKVF